MPRLKTIEITPSVPKKRIRRTEDQLILELQAEIERLKAKAAVKAVKKDPSAKHTIGAVRSIDEALASATNLTLREALGEARSVLVAYLQLAGLKLPQKRGRKTGWRKNAEAQKSASIDG